MNADQPIKGSLDTEYNKQGIESVENSPNKHKSNLMMKKNKIPINSAENSGIKSTPVSI
jgi:hypothetical protein